MTRGVVYFLQDFYSPTRFVVSTTSSGSQVIKNFHLGETNLISCFTISPNLIFRNLKKKKKKEQRPEIDNKN